MSMRVLSSATLLALALAVAGAVVLVGAQVTPSSMPRVAPAVDTADGRSTAPAPETYTGGSTYVPTTGQDTSQPSNPLQSDPDSYAPGAGSPATQTRPADEGAAPAQAPALQPGPAVAPSRFLDADPSSPEAQLGRFGPHFKMRPGAEP
jgi:hypothetical protein